MKKVATVTLASLFCLAGLVSAQGQDSLNLRHIQMADNKRLHFVRVSLQLYDVRILSPLVTFNTDGSARRVSGNPERAVRGVYLQEYMTRFGAHAVGSGGYIDSYSPPSSLGLVKSGGVMLGSEHNSWLTEAIFCSDQGKATIALAKSFSASSEFRDCVQAGPLLLQNGKVPSELLSHKSSGYLKLAASVQEQMFICIDSKQQLLLGITDKIDIPTLTATLTKPEVGCSNAIRLTGQDTAGLRTKDNLYGNDDYLFPNAIGVIRRTD